MAKQAYGAWRIPSLAAESVLEWRKFMPAYNWHTINLRLGAGDELDL
ncbi:MAG: hypothetical protein P4M04_10220 [Acidobacteriota bacterium]|nr:hypothetical protein [Acidobacteriota bacterium]